MNTPNPHTHPNQVATINYSFQVGALSTMIFGYSLYRMIQLKKPFKKHSSRVGVFSMIVLLPLLSQIYPSICIRYQTNEASTSRFGFCMSQCPIPKSQYQGFCYGSDGVITYFMNTTLSCIPNLFSFGWNILAYYFNRRNQGAKIDIGGFWILPLMNLTYYFIDQVTLFNCSTSNGITFIAASVAQLTQPLFTFIFYWHIFRGTVLERMKLIQTKNFNIECQEIMEQSFYEPTIKSLYSSYYSSKTKRDNESQIFYSLESNNIIEQDHTD